MSPCSVDVSGDRFALYCESSPARYIAASAVGIRWAFIVLRRARTAGNSESDKFNAHSQLNHTVLGV